jgi:hypothetical protein
MVKSGPIFDQAAMLGKASRDAYNLGLWLLLKVLLKNRVAEGVASDPHDTTPQHQSTYLGAPESASIETLPFRNYFIKFS